MTNQLINSIFFQNVWQFDSQPEFTSDRSRISPRWGANSPGGINIRFGKFSPKMHGIEEFGPLGDAHQ